MRVAVRHRLVGDRQRREVRSRLLCRPDLWTLSPQVSCSGCCCSTMSPCRPSCPACSASCAGRPRPKEITTPNASACSARSLNPPTTPSSRSRWTAPSPPGTGPPNACLDSARRKRSAIASISSCRPNGAPSRVRCSIELREAKASSSMIPCGMRKDGSRGGRLAGDLSDQIGRGRDRRCLQDRAATSASASGPRQALNQEIEERRRIFETSQDLILVTDTKGNFVQVSPSSMTILGYEPTEMIGHSAVEFIHPDDLDRTRAEMRAGAARPADAQLRDALRPQGRTCGDADLDGNMVGAGAAAFLRRP